MRLAVHGDAVQGQVTLHAAHDMEDEAQQAAEHIRRSAKTKLVSIIPTLMASPQPMTQPMPMPTLLDGDLPSKPILPSRTLYLTLLGALIMSVLVLVLYALLG